MDIVSAGLREPLALKPTAPITPPKQRAQTDLKGVWQVAKIDDGHAIVLADSKGAAPKLVEGNASQFTLDPATTLDLTTIPLP